MPELCGTKPLLTIAIPTYNRASELAEMLEVLLPQLAAHPEVDLFVSDNCSPDGTEGVVQGLAERGLRVRYLRQAENIGSDRNFVACYENAIGSFFWLCGDDDIILPGTLDRVVAHLGGPLPVDLMYVTSYGFREDWVRERTDDPLQRLVHTFTDARRLARVVNIMFTFISAIIVNRDRLKEIPHEEPSALLGTNLIQLGWCLPLLLEHRRSVVIWQRSVAGRQGNAGGYAIGKVFGLGLTQSLARLLPGRPELQRAIVHPTIRRWLPSALYAIRAENNDKLGLSTAEADLVKAYGGNIRYWLFAYPVLRLPLVAARLWFKLGTAFNMAIYMVTVPGFWKKQS